MVFTDIFLLELETINFYSTKTSKRYYIALDIFGLFLLLTADRRIFCFSWLNFQKNAQIYTRVSQMNMFPFVHQHIFI